MLIIKEGALQPQSIELLPVVEEKMQNALQAAELTLANLEAMKSRPELLGDKTNESFWQIYY